MRESNNMWVACKIENSGFSSERRFEVGLADGGKVVGTAYIEYLRDANKRELGENVPPYGETMNGVVQCRVIRQEEEGALVEFPGTDLFHVPREALLAQ